MSIVCSCAFDVTKRMSPSGNTRDDDDDDDGDNNNNNNNDVPTWPATLSMDAWDNSQAVPEPDLGIALKGSSLMSGSQGVKSLSEEDPLIPPAISIVKTSLPGQKENKQAEIVGEINLASSDTGDYSGGGSTTSSSDNVGYGAIYTSKRKS